MGGFDSNSIRVHLCERSGSVVTCVKNSTRMDTGGHRLGRIPDLRSSAEIRTHLRENFNANGKEWDANGRESSPRWCGKNLNADERRLPQMDADAGEWDANGIRVNPSLRNLLVIPVRGIIGLPLAAFLRREEGDEIAEVARRQGRGDRRHR